MRAAELVKRIESGSKLLVKTQVLANSYVETPLLVIEASEALRYARAVVSDFGGRAEVVAEAGSNGSSIVLV